MSVCLCLKSKGFNYVKVKSVIYFIGFNYLSFTYQFFKNLNPEIIVLLTWSLSPETMKNLWRAKINTQPVPLRRRKKYDMTCTNTTHATHTHMEWTVEILRKCTRLMHVTFVTHLLQMLKESIKVSSITVRRWSNWFTSWTSGTDLCRFDR